MIISHKHKYIFLKTNKTAGTSIEIALSKFCGPSDIITPISAEDELKRKSLGYPGPQNYLKPAPILKILDLFRYFTKKESPWRAGKREKLFYNHISAELVKARIDNEVWDGYFKFCFERNPWDRVISQFYFRNRNKPESITNISEFIQSEAPLLLKKRGYELYTINGKIAVDRVCRFENLSDEIETIRKKVGIPEKLQLPKAKTSFRKDKRNYREIINNEDKEIIANIFKEEIDLLGYSW